MCYIASKDFVYFVILQVRQCQQEMGRLPEGTCGWSAHRYSKQADWAYIGACAAAAPELQLIGNGDILSYTEYNERMAACPQLATVMLARGALIKPWLFTEVIMSSWSWQVHASVCTASPGNATLGACAGCGYPFGISGQPALWGQHR